MPADFGLPRDRTDVWCVPGFDLKGTSRPSHYLQSMGRLKPGVSLQQAQMEMNTIAERLAATYKQPFGVRLVSLQNEIVGNARRSLLVLWAGGAGRAADCLRQRGWTLAGARRGAAKRSCYPQRVGWQPRTAGSAVPGRKRFAGIAGRSSWPGALVFRWTLRCRGQPGRGASATRSANGWPGARVYRHRLRAYRDCVWAGACVQRVAR